MSELRRPDAARLMAPRADRVEPDHEGWRRRIGRLRRLPLAYEGAERSREPCREGVGDVVIARDRKHGRAEAAKEPGCTCKLVLLAPVAQVPACDHELRLEPVDQDTCAPLDPLVVPRPVMEVGQV